MFFSIRVTQQPTFTYHLKTKQYFASKQKLQSYIHCWIKSITWNKIIGPKEKTIQSEKYGYKKIKAHI